MEDKVTMNVLDKLKKHNVNLFNEYSTISEILKWFRDEKKFFITCSTHKYPGKRKWRWEIINLRANCLIAISDGHPNDVHLMDIDPGDNWGYIYNSYEDAALSGIEYMCDNYKKIW